MFSSRRRSADRMLVEAGWPLGFVRDCPRHAIPPGGSYGLLDYLLDKPGVLYKRGGASYQSAALSGEVDIIGMAAPEYPGDPRVVAFASNGSDTTAYDITGTSPGTGQDCNSALLLENPPLYIDRLIICDGLGVAPPQKVTAALAGDISVADLGGDPPTAKYSCLHAGRLVLANSNDEPNRVWFSDPLDAENTWDTTDGYIDVDEPVTGLASIQGVLIVFSRGHNQRILGDVPPGYGTVSSEVNMSLQPASTCGCIDARSIVRDDEWIYVANEQGVFRVNGAGQQSMTTKDDASGIAAFWAETIYRFSPALGAVVASGVYLDHLVVSVKRPSNEELEIEGARTQIACFLPTGAWTRLSGGVGGTMYATRFAPFYEMYYGINTELASDSNRARFISSIFSASATDPDGTDIEPLFESRTLGLEAGVGMKHYDLAHLTYRLDTDDDATLAVSRAAGLEADGSFDAVDESPLLGSAEIKRSRFTLARQNQGIAVRVQQAGASSATELYLLETVARTLDPGGGP